MGKPPSPRQGLVSTPKMEFVQANEFLPLLSAATKHLEATPESVPAFLLTCADRKRAGLMRFRHDQPDVWWENQPTVLLYVGCEDVHQQELVRSAQQLSVKGQAKPRVRVKEKAKGKFNNAKTPFHASKAPTSETNPFRPTKDALSSESVKVNSSASQPEDRKNWVCLAVLHGLDTKSGRLLVSPLCNGRQEMQWVQQSFPSLQPSIDPSNAGCTPTSLNHFSTVPCILRLFSISCQFVLGYQCQTEPLL